MLDTTACFARIQPAPRLNQGIAAMAAVGLLGMVIASPAMAGTGEWGPACNFSAAPQGYGDQIRYNNCIRQSDCQQLVNAAGQRIVSSGCFWVDPDPVAARMPAHRTRLMR